MLVELRTFDLEFLERSWAWLQDPETRRLTLTPEFTKEDQQRFFEGLEGRTDYRVWGVYLQDVGPVGAAGLKNIDGTLAEYWGYIGEKAWWGQGIGRRMLSAVEREALALGIRRLNLKVGDDNDRAKRLYVAAGYRMVSSGSEASVMVKELCSWR